MAVRKVKKKRERKNRLSSMAVIFVMFVFIGIIAVQIKNLEATNTKKSAELKVRQEAYEQESERTQELEDQRVYVQTKKYVEESAKKLGFVYPDELILKPDKE